MQDTAPGSKAAKFVAANPFGPMADPFAGMDDDQKEYQKQLSENVNNRVQDGLKELKKRHENGTNEVDDRDRAPTGDPYRAHQAQMLQKLRREKIEEEKRKANNIARHQTLQEESKNIFSNKNGEDGDDEQNDDSDDEYDDLLNDDIELDAIRQRRIKEMREAQAKAAEMKSLGHGDYRTISQDDFLPECTGKSEYVAVHFFHKGFERCKIMDHHLKIIASLHISCKFLRMDAEKCPFFIARLKIRTLPTLIIFQDGKAADRLTGFEGLAKDPSNPDNWETGRLQEWIAKTGAIKYKRPTEEIKEEMRRMGIKPRGTVWSGTRTGGFYEAEYDEDS